jgi:probable rRNA maturation factor
MLSIQKNVEFEIDEKILIAILDYLEIKREVELIICDNEEIRKINKNYRGIDKETDVLSFPVEGNFQELPLGSIIISKDKVLEVSKRLKHSEKEEFSLLFIHGLLHLLGFDHEIDNGQMRQKEEEIIKRFNLPKSLIVRSE